MRVLVTGAAGFIGSNLVDHLLAEGEDVYGLDDLSSGSLANLANARATELGKFTFDRMDITSTATGDLIRKVKPDMIMHLAAQVDVRDSVTNPINDAMINVIGSLNVLHAATEAGTKKVVFTSSGGCIYGEPGEDRLPVTEDQVYFPESAPESPYGVSKKVVLDYLRYFKIVKDLDYTALALANVYGPRQEPASEVGLEGQVVAIFSRRMIEGKPTTIYGDGEQSRDFVYVDDVVSAFLATRDKGSGELINVSSNSEITVNDLHAKIKGITGSELEVQYAPARPGELFRTRVDNGKAREVLGWEPRVDLDQGLAQTVAWFKAKI